MTMISGYAKHVVLHWLVVGVVAAVAAGACAGDPATDAASSSQPWGPNVVTPADLVKELASAEKPVVVCTAPEIMFRQGHIPGAVFHGPASWPAGLNDLTAWAQPLPRTTSIVIYCGCCPLDHCPNLRPAYAALKELGFTRLRVLVLPENFGSDWVDRGYPLER